MRIVIDIDCCAVFLGLSISYQIQLWLLSRSAAKLVHG